MTVLLIGIAVAVGTMAIRVAAAWTASAAPLEASPVSADELRARLVDETGRSAMLEDRLATLTTRAQELESALTTAQARLDSDANHAQDLATQLAVAKKKLAALERSIRAAQTSRPAVVVTTSSAGGRATVAERESDDD